jgi:hypothetical protein
MLDKFKALSEIFTYIEEKLGFRKFTQYVFFVILIFGMFNFRSIIRTVIEISSEISEEQHAKKMTLRDELLDELNPILTEMRATIGADRVLYLEYHNSKENLVGIPFKYVDLVLPVKSYGVPEFDYSKYKEISSGVITVLYQDLRKSKVIINKGASDNTFLIGYPGISEYIESSDGSKQQCFLNLPGINSPIGLIIVEWVEDEERDWDKIEKVSQSYISRINGLVLSKSEKKTK